MIDSIEINVCKHISTIVCNGLYFFESVQNTKINADQSNNKALYDKNINIRWMELY